jgi:hypothetical protein
MKTAEEWIEYCESRAGEACKQAMQAGLDEAAVQAVTMSVYQDSMPACCGGTVKYFISCIAHGMLVGLIPTAEGKAMLYAAQVALQAKKAGNRKGGIR